MMVGTKVGAGQQAGHQEVGRSEATIVSGGLKGELSSRVTKKVSQGRRHTGTENIGSE